MPKVAAPRSVLLRFHNGHLDHTESATLSREGFRHLPNLAHIYGVYLQTRRN